VISKLINHSLKGEMYIELLVNILIYMILLIFIIVLIPIFVYKANLNTYADKVLRIAELSGNTKSQEVSDKIISMQTSTGITPQSISWEGTDYTSGSKIQLGDEIVITLKSQYNIGFSVFGDFNVPLTAKAKGSSEVYWK